MHAASRSGRLTTHVTAILAAFAVLILWLASMSRPGPGGPVSGSEHPAVGTTLAAMTLKPLTGDGPQVTLESLRGSVVMVNFWGEWCGPCKYEFPSLVELRRELEPRGLVFLSVSSGAGQDEDLDELREATLEYLRANQWTDFSTYHDPRFVSRLALIDSANLGGFAYPTTVLIDRRGAIAALWVGYWDGAETDMRQQTTQLLSRK